jgi:hypothetical protein
MLDGKILVDKGVIIDLDDPLARIPIDRAESISTGTRRARRWSCRSRCCRAATASPCWRSSTRRAKEAACGASRSPGGTVVLASAAPVGSECAHPQPHRAAACGSTPPSSASTSIRANWATADLGVALTGSLDFSSDDPRLVLGIAGTRMSVAAMKLLWPICTAPKVRAWVEEHVLGGTVDRLDISTNAPWSTLKSSGPPVPDDGLLIQIVGNGAEVRPVRGLPAIRDADVNLRISGRTAVINVGRGNVKYRPAASSPSPTACSRCPTRSRRRRRRRRASASTARCRPAANSWEWNGCANIPARRSIPRPVAGRSPRK